MKKHARNIRLKMQKNEETCNKHKAENAKK